MFLEPILVINDIKIDIEIDIPKIISVNHDVDEFLISNIYNHHQIADYANNVDKSFNKVHGFISKIFTSSINNIHTTTKWIPYSRISNLEKIAEGGFSIIYKATTHTNGTIAVKKILNSQDISKCFLNEVIIIFLIIF